MRRRVVTVGQLTAASARRPGKRQTPDALAGRPALLPDWRLSHFSLRAVGSLPKDSAARAGAAGGGPQCQPLGRRPRVAVGASVRQRRRARPGFVACAVASRLEDGTVSLWARLPRVRSTFAARGAGSVGLPLIRGRSRLTPRPLCRHSVAPPRCTYRSLSPRGPPGEGCDGALRGLAPGVMRFRVRALVISP